MKHCTPTPSNRNARAFLASLLSYLLVVGQFAPAALAANGSAMRAAPPEAAGGARAGGGESQRFRGATVTAAPAAPVPAPIIGASKVDKFTDGDGDGKADPGQDINYEVTVSNTGDAPATNVEFTDSIGSNLTLDAGSVTMSPLARDDAYTAIVGSQLVVSAASGVLSNDSGTTPMTATAIAAGPTDKGGTVTLAADGSFTYDPPAGAFSGADSFTYTAVNGNAPPNASDATGTVTISFDPAAIDDSPSVSEDAAATTVDVLANDTDPDAGAKTIDTVTQPANGTVAITNSGADLTYEPDANYCNSQAGGTPDTFTYKLTPGGDEATVSVTVTCVDDAPVANDDAATLNEDAAATAVDVLANDTDVETDAVTITSASDPAHGTVVLTGPAGAHTGLTYQPDANYCNSPPGTTPDTFTYTVNGGDTATVNVTVTCQDDSPTGVNDSATVPEDSSNNVVDVLANDTDADGGDKFITSASDPANGTVTLTGPAGAHTGLTYTPDANYCNSQAGGTPDTFTYTLSPGGSVATVSVTVTCDDDAPVANDDTASIAEDAGATAVNVLSNDTDIDGGPMNITAASDPAHGTVVLTGPAGAHTGLTYQPDADYNGSDSFTYTLNGGDTATVNVTVTEVNDAPTAAGDTLTDVLEDSSTRVIAFTALTGNDTAGPANESGQTLSVTNVSSPAGGSVVINGTNVEFTPTANFCGAAGFTYTVTDDGTTNGASDPKSANAAVSFNITCTNDAPSFTPGADVTVNEDSGPYSAGWATGISAGPGEAQNVTFNVTNNTAPALFAVGGAPAIAANGTLTFTPAANAFGTATITVVLSDDGGTANGGDDTADAVQLVITINPVNDAPVAGTDSFETIGNTELRVDLAAGATPNVPETTGSSKGALHNDSDPVEGDPFQVTGIVGCADATAPFDCTVAGQHIVMEADGKFSYVPAVEGASGTFQYTITDSPAVGTAASANGTVNITIHDMVWYVDGTAAAGGTGQSDRPFNSFASLNGAGGAGDSDDPGHFIFVHESSLNASLELEADQHLYGEGYGLIIQRDLNGNGSPTTVVPAGTQPSLNGGASDAVRVTAALPAEIRGLSLSSTGSNAIDVTSTGAYSGAATLVISGNTFTNSAGQTVDVNSGATGSRAITVSNNTWTGSVATHTGGGLEVSTTGSATGALSLDVSGNSIVSNGTAIAVDGSVVGAGGSIQIRGFASNQISGNTGGTGVAINTATFDATFGGAYNIVDGGDTDIGAAGVGGGVGGAGMLLTNVRGDLSFTDLDVYASNGAALFASSNAAFNASGAGLRIQVASGAGTFSATGGPALEANQVLLNLPVITLNTSGSPTSGVNLIDTDGSTVSATAGSISTSSATATAFRVANSNGGSYSYAGTINTTDGKGVELTTNPGATIAFTGALTISSGANAAFAATGGGTVSATDSTSTLTTTTGTALNVTNTDIGLADLTFRSISANGAANGIVLNNTGSSGGLTVSGNGGTCTVATPTCTGGTIQNTTGDAVELANTRDVSFTRLRILNAGAEGVDGTGVVNFTFANGLNIGAGDADNEDGFDFGDLSATNITGTLSITNSVVQQFTNDGLVVRNTSGNVNVTLTGNTFFDNDGTAFGVNGVLIEALGTGTASLNATGNTFDKLEGEAIQFEAENGTNDVNIIGNTMSQPAGHANTNFEIGGGVTIITDRGALVTFDIQGNYFNRIADDGIVIVGEGDAEGRIGGDAAANQSGPGGANQGNTIRQSGSQNGCAGDGIRLDFDGTFQTTYDGNDTWEVLVKGNFIDQHDGTDVGGDLCGGRSGEQGINILNRDHVGTMHVTVDNNTVNDSLLQGLRSFTADRDGAVSNGPNTFLAVTNNSFNNIGSTGEVISVSVDDQSDVCANVSGNAGSSINSGTNILLERRVATSVFNVPQASTAAISAANNNVGVTLGAQPLTFNSACNPTQPSNAAVTRFDETSANGKGAWSTEGTPSSATNSGMAVWPVGTFRNHRQEEEAPAATQGRRQYAPSVPNNVAPPPAAPTAPEPNAAPAAPARSWSDIPVVIMPAPRRGSAAAESDEAEKAEGDEEENKDGEETDAAKESDSAAPPDAPKSRVKRTETYRPKQESAPAEREQQPQQPEPPSLRNISYVGPLGSAPSGGARFARASYSPSGERGVRTERSAHAVKPAAKAAAKAKAAAAAPLAAAACTPGPALVCVQIGTLPAGKSVMIRFKAKVDSPFTGATEQVENQGEVSFTEGAKVLTDDPSLGGAADKTITEIAAPPDIVVHNASVPEPKSGSTNMPFTITLSRNPPGNVTVDFETQDETPAGAGKAVAGSDYTTTTGQVTFVPGQRVYTVSVPVLHNAPAEPDETFKLRLTGATGGSITDGEATGTITANATPGAILISEVRTSGPGGAEDDFVEIYNNSDSAVTVPAGGWGLFKMGGDCTATPVLVGTVPAGTIAARSYFLLVGSQYSLKDYGGTDAAEKDADLSSDIENDRNIALFSTTDVAQLSAVTRLDAVGFGTNNQGNCNLLREGNNLGAAGGSTLEYSFFRKLCGYVQGTGCQTNGTPLDTQDNANDFAVAETTGMPVGSAGQRLGAPGPQNSGSPVQTNSITVNLLDSSAGGPAPPNRVRNGSDNPFPGITNAGTMSIRRRVVNNTGGPISRLRFRISELTTSPTGPGQADLRALTGSPISNVSITNDSATCEGPSSCTVTVEATTLEEPPNQPAGGGLNSTLTVTLGTPLADGDHVLVHFYLGVRQTGLFRFYIVTEVLP